MIKSFVIRKPNDDLSERLADECIESAKQFGIHPEKVSGVYSDHDFLLAKKGVSPFFKMKESKKNNPGIKGCFLSHFLLWEKCIELNEPIIIFEHDGLMIRPLPDNIENMFTHILLLDYASRLENYEGIVKTDSELKITNFDRILGPMKYKSINKTHFRGSHAHMVKPLGAKTLIESSKKNGFLPLDMAVNQYYTSYSIIDPLIARLNPFFSGGNNREHSHTK